MERKGVRVCSFSESYFPECGTSRLFGQREAACWLVCEHGVVWEEGEGGWWLGVSTLQQQAFCGSGDKHKHRAAVSILFSLRGQSQITACCERIRLRESVRVSNVQISVSTLQMNRFGVTEMPESGLHGKFFFPLGNFGIEQQGPVLYHHSATCSVTQRGRCEAEKDASSHMNRLSVFRTFGH